MKRLALFFLLAGPALAALPDLARTVEAITEKCRAAREYTFEGELLLAGQRNGGPPQELSRAKVKLALAPGGKSYLRIEPEGKDAYVLVSDGQKSWAWVPRLKQYTEDESGAREEENGDEEGSDTERDLGETFVRTVMPALARLNVNVQGADFAPEVPVKFGNRKEKWPVLRVLSRPESDKSQTLTQLAIDPDTLDIGRMIYSTVMREDNHTKIQMTIDFNAFQIGPVPEATFAFEPPKGARLVDTVPIPGQTGSFLLNQPAPDFELKNLEGEKVHLADLRGRPVLLSFWASWCGPCRRELPELSKLSKEYREKGLVILGVNDEGKSIARKYAELTGLAFQTLDDSGFKAHRLYRVHSIPTLFLIDKNGKIVLFLKGAREPERLRASLAGAGL